MGVLLLIALLLMLFGVYLFSVIFIQSQHGSVDYAIKKKFAITIGALIIIVLIVLVTRKTNSINSAETHSGNVYKESTEEIVNDTSFDETTEPVIEETTESETDFKASCVEIPYKKLLRTPDDYINQRIVITAKIQQVMQGGWFDDGVYYRLQTDDGGYESYFGDEYYMYDCRSMNDLKLLKDDVLKVYAEFSGLKEIKRALTGEKEEIPAINAYYIELISE